ncbi:MAG: YtxH domain-containing protein [Gemmatimonadota bacterium]|nr:YtxH domain-containing protein [Gemmatimonadota bacterium]
MGDKLEERMAEDEGGTTELAEDEADGGRGLGRFAAGVVFGALLGAGIALMFAPERGDKARHRLRRRLERLREDTAEGLGRAGSLTRREVLRRRRGAR